MYSGNKLDVSKKKYKKITEELSDEDDLSLEQPYRKKRIESVQQDKEEYMTGGMSHQVDKDN